ncbi:tail fiber domain-containing protein [Klebsiella pneumoniae]|nr:tail fiber domain-containing protein [Klebsiella pneumoniae]
MAEVPLPTPTQVPVPSTDIRNAVFAGAKLDEEVTGSGEYYTDRLGVKRLTNTGRNNKFNSDQSYRSETFQTMISAQEIAFDYQLHQQAQMFTTAMLEQKNAWDDQMEDQKDEFIDLLTSSGYSWLNDYIDGPVTFFNRSQVTVYNGVAYRLATSTPVGFTTTGTSAESWANDKDKLVPIGDNDIRQQVQYQLGKWLPSAAALMLSEEDASAIYVRGFYGVNDGGAGTWLATGVTITGNAGKHIPSTAKIYNKNGVEYSLDISSGVINVLANGLKPYTYAQCKDDSTDNYVCAAEVYNGIISLLPPAVYTSNNEASYTGGRRLKINFPSVRTRFGKTYFKKASGVCVNGNSVRLILCAGPSTKFSTTGVRIDGFSHGYNEIKEKWDAVNSNLYWGSLSLQDFKLQDIILIGDHDITKTASACTGGVGNMTLNPEGEIVSGLYVKDFNWDRVAMPSQIEATYFNKQGHAFDNNELDYKYITDFMVNSSGVPTRAGNFNRVKEDNCKYESGRRGVYRNSCDWTTLTNCEIINRRAWWQSGNVDGTIPEYIAVCTGTAMHVSGGYWGPAAAKDYNGRLGTVYGTAQNHVFSGVYTEWTYNFYTVSRWGFNGKASRLFSLHLDCLSTYKDDARNYCMLRFEGGCFPTTDDGGNSIYPDGFYHYDTPNGLSGLSFNSPVRDWGAFHHGGYDNKFGPYNWYVGVGTDWDSWRDRPYAKEMFNPYGFAINAGPAMALWANPSIKSEIGIWIKDLSGNFDPQRVYAWITAAGQESSANTDTALYKAQAELWVDFNNGYKLLKITNKRLTAWDGLFSYQRNCGIYFDVPSDGSTPIVVKAIEAYTGGIPVFPNGCGNYVPESAATSVLSTATNIVGAGFSIGGGIFSPGDIIGPWSHVRRTQSGYVISPTLTPGYTLDRKMVTGGCTLEAAFKVAFSATVTTVNSNATTIITVPAAYLPYVAVGIPLYITGGSSTGVTGQVRLIKRLMNSDGTLSPRYLVQGTIGAVGDTLTIDQAQVPAYTFYNDRNFNAITATSVTISGVSVANAHRSTYSSAIGYGGASGAKALEFYVNGGTTYTQRIVATSTTVMSLETGGNLSVNGNTYPNADGTYSLGTPSGRWSQVFASNSVIGTSDETHKTRPRADTPAETDAYYEIGQLPGVWQWLEKYMVEGDGARLHSGPTVQAAIAVMDKYGLDWREYSAFCYDEWDAQDAIIETWDDEWEVIPGTPAELDEAGNVLVEAVPETRTLIRAAGSNVIQEAREAGSVYAFRKEELLFWISRATIAKQQDIEKRLAAIEASMSS